MRNMLLITYLKIDILLFHNFIYSSISSQLFPHLLKGRIFLRLLTVIRPLHFIFLFSLIQHSSPILLLKLILNLLYIFVRLIQDINSLIYISYTSILICCIYTSSNFVFINFILTYPLSICLSKFFFTVSNGISYFLLPVCLKAGTFQLIFCYI